MKLNISYEIDINPESPKGVESEVADLMSLGIMRSCVELAYESGECSSEEYEEALREIDLYRKECEERFRGQESVCSVVEGGLEKKVGFWRRYEHNASPLPWPIPSPVEIEGKGLFLTRLAEVETQAVAVRYRGYSPCRICGKPCGSVEFELDGWVWPGGYRHYIEFHNVPPDEEFRKFVMTSQL